MTAKKITLSTVLAILSALLGYQIGLADLANFAHDSFTVIHKHLDKACFYQLHENILFTICPRGVKPNA